MKVRLPGTVKNTSLTSSKIRCFLRSHFSFQWVLYLVIFYSTTRISWLYHQFHNGTVSDRISATVLHLQLAFTTLSFSFRDVCIGIAVTLLSILLLTLRKTDVKKYRQGEEYGSARWGTPEDIAPFIDPNPNQNIILTATESLMMNGRPKERRYGRNKNVMIIGATGTGKSAGFVKPNLEQLHSSYVVVDPKGELLASCGTMFKEHGYRIRVLNTVDFSKSMHYNPFSYVKTEKDIMKLVNVLIENTKTEGERSADGFWEKAERLLLTALISLMMSDNSEKGRYDHNFGMLLDLLNLCRASEKDENQKSDMDEFMEELEQKDPNHFAVRQYRRYKQAAGKTAKSILISCGARLAPFDIQELRDLMQEDEMYLDTIGDIPTALFVIISDTDSTFNFVVAMLYSQLFNVLCEKADASPGGRLKIHVRCMLDEFANIGKIPNFEKLIATIRSREISASIILQSVSQLKTLYKDAADTILGNCDSHLFLGSKESGTLKQMSEALGKETIDLQNTSRNRGNSESFGTNWQKTGKSLMTPDELAVMDGNKCILQLRGVRPFFSDKYDFTKHPRYHELADEHPERLFDICKYLEEEKEHRSLRLRMKEEFTVFEFIPKGGEENAQNSGQTLEKKVENI